MQLGGFVLVKNINMKVEGVFHSQGYISSVVKMGFEGHQLKAFRQVGEYILPQFMRQFS